MKSPKTYVVSAVVLLSVLLAGCANASNSKKWINSNLDGNLLSEKPSLKDDFYQSVNYEALKMPLSESGFMLEGAGPSEIEKLLVSQISSMTAGNNPEKQQLIDLYNMGMDWDSRNKLGMQPIMPVLKKIQSVKSIEQLNEIFMDEETRFFFPVLINLRSKREGIYSPQIRLCFSFGKSYSIAYEFYDSMFQKAGYSPSERGALLHAAYNFEKQYNSKVLQNKNSSYIDFYYNQVVNTFKNFPVSDYLESYRVSFLKYFVAEELEVFDSLYTEENLEAIKTLCVCNLFDYSGWLLDRECCEYSQKLKERTIGKTISYSDKEAAVLVLDDYIPYFLGKVWCEEFCSKEIITDVEQVVEDVLEHYTKQISSWEWLSTGSRYNLVLLLGRIKILAGHSTFYDYSELQLKDTLFNSIISVVNYEKKLQAKKCYLNADPYEWTEPPQIYNAFFNGNHISIHAGLIFGLNYNVNDSYEKKLGTLGCIIAHEISHLFSGYSNDDGSVYQNLGSKDYNEIIKRLDVISNYYSSFDVLPDIKCNGYKCRPEIGADAFGMNVILQIAKEIPGFDYNVFFEEFAKTYLFKSTEVVLKNTYESDNHPAFFIRVNALVQQFDEFYEAFGVKRGDGMYLAPEKRFKL